MRPGRWALNVYAALGFAYLFAPIAVIVLFSFNDPAGNFNIEWRQFTLDNCKAPFADRALTSACGSAYGLRRWIFSCLPAGSSNL